jgi:hypothetical protein
MNSLSPVQSILMNRGEARQAQSNSCYFFLVVSRVTNSRIYLLPFMSANDLGVYSASSPQPLGHAQNKNISTPMIQQVS